MSKRRNRKEVIENTKTESKIEAIPPYMVLQLNETCRVSQASCWEGRHQPDARSENDTKCLHLLFYCSNLDNLSLCVYNQWYHWAVVDMKVVSSAVTKGIFKASGIQINKTLKKSTYLAPHMLLRVHCDVAAYGQKYVCFVTILMCMTPMTGWNNYAKYKATWTRLRNCEDAWPKSEVTLPKYTILLQRTNVTDKGMESTNL